MIPQKLAISAALKAGKLIKKSLGTLSGQSIENKNPFDFVTIIDKQAEQLIIDLIQKYFPDHEIFAEESGSTPQKNTSMWIIDPFDGTTNFIHGFPHSAVSIAYEYNGELVLGVVFDPFRDELFYAEKGKGAFLDNRPIHVSNRSKLNECLIATGFPFRNKNLLAPYWQALSNIFLAVCGIRRTGSAALDLAYTACGRFDGFWELKLSPWDVAAGAVLLHEAGGKITDFELKNNHLNTGNVIASNGLIHEFLFQKIHEAFPKNP